MTTLPKTGISPLTQKLVQILTSMLVSSQDYQMLVDGLVRFRDTHTKLPLLLDLLTTYFTLFATGYAHWQQSYEYPRVHEYFYGAYLQAKTLATNQSQYQPLIDMLETMTYAFIAYTGCENALINNDSQALKTASNEAIKYGTEVQNYRNACQHLSTSEPGLDELLKPIADYMQINLHLWHGLASCAEGYLRVPKGKFLSPDEQNKIKEHLDKLDELSLSPELFSELNAHYAFVCQLNDLYKKKPHTIRVKRGTVFLRAIGYVGKDIVAAFFDRFANGNSTTLSENMREKSKLPVQTIRSSYTMDIFKTVLGKRFHEPLVFELSMDSPDSKQAPDSKNSKQAPILTFNAHQKPYTIESVQMTLNHLGTLTIEFSIPLEDASISRIRMLESLIGPHSGRFNFIWHEDKNNLTAESENPDDPSRDYVEIFMRSKKLQKEIKQEVQAKNWRADLKQEIENKINSIDSILSQWEQNLEDIAGYLPQHSTGSDRTTELQKIYADLIKHYNEMDVLIGSLKKHTEKLQDTDDLPLKQFSELFPQGKTFGLLMGLAKFLIDTTTKFLKEEYIAGLPPNEQKKLQKNKKEKHTAGAPANEQKNEEELDIRYAPHFDSDLGWQSIIECKQLVIKDPYGNKLIPGPGADLPYADVQDYPEFKSFSIWPREARAGIDDWLFVTKPQIENLATIRSHIHDVLYVGSHKAFLWFPDDPQFLTDQYLETVRFIAEIRTLVLTFNKNAKEQIDRLEQRLNDLKKIKNNSRKKIREELLEIRDSVEIFHIQAEKVVDLLRACSVSKYQDHSELLKRMLKASQADDSQASLESNIESINNLHTYISDSLKQKIDEQTQNFLFWLTLIGIIFTFFSTVSGFISISSFFDKIGISSIWLIPLFIILAILIVGVVFFVIRRRRENA